jgi:hypothetical protein
VSSLDYRYLFVTDTAATENDTVAGRWQVFGTETGERLGSIMTTPGFREVAVVGSRAFVLYVLPREQPTANGIRRVLKAFDLGTGKSLWERRLAPEIHLPPRP